MREEFLVFGSPLIEEAEIAEVVDSLRSGWIGTGPKVQRFEQMLEAYIGVTQVRCVSSCTAALSLAMRILDIGPGDEVLVPAMTFVATANAVEHTGARPIFVDCEPETGLVDLEAAEAAVTERTRAIVPVHLWGRPVDIDALNRFRDRLGLTVVEDAAHAIGARWRGQPIGSSGNLTAYSFYPTKNITTIEGGALATDDPEVAARVEQLALHGLSLGAWQRFSDTGYKHYDATEPGFKFNMTDVQAALGIHQLPRLDGWIARRAELASRYTERLADLPLELPPAPARELTHAWHLYPVQVGDSCPVTRDELLESLTRQNIGVGVHYRGVHLQPYYRDKYGLRAEQFPVATRISERVLSLPLSPKLSLDDQDDVVEALEVSTASGAGRSRERSST